MDVSMLDYQVRAHELAPGLSRFWDGLSVGAIRAILASREGLVVVNRASALAVRLQNLLYEGKDLDKEGEVEIALHLGKVLWSLSEVATLLNMNLPTIAKLYLEKKKAELPVSELPVND